MSAHTAPAVALVEQPLTQARALVGRSVGHVPAPEHPMFTVDRDMVLVAECRNGDVDRRTHPVGPRLGLAELDRPARRGPCAGAWSARPSRSSGKRPFLNGLLLVFGVPLLGRGDQRRVDDLAAHGDVAGLAQRRVEPVEQIRSVQVGWRVGLRIFLIQGTERWIRAKGREPLWAWGAIYHEQQMEVNIIT